MRNEEQYHYASLTEEDREAIVVADNFKYEEL